VSVPSTGDFRVGVDDIASVCEFVLALSKVDGWLYTDTPVTVEQVEWSAIPGLPTDSEDLRFAGRMPLLESNQWVSSGLLNTADFDGDAAAIYRDPGTNDIAVKTWSNRYPTLPDDGTADSMPKANVAASWGDFVFLGDIEYLSDPTQPFSALNSTRFPHGLWRSIAGTSDRWSIDDVFFVGQKLENNAVLGMFPVERGLIVVTQSTIALLRGTPDDFAYEELRNGISPEARDEVTFWPYAGLVVWIDRFGRVWATNGDVVARLDNGLSIERSGPGCILAVDQNLFVSGRVDVRVFHSFGEQGAWTTLLTPSGWQKAVFCRATVIGVGADQDTAGTFVLDDAVFGLLGENTLHGSVDSVQVFNLQDEDRRGTFNNQPVRPVLRTRPLPGASDRTIFWHRFGLRGNGPGRLRKATSYDTADLSRRGLESRVNGRFADRKDWTFEAHGPSLEAVFEFEFEGDVTPEHVSVAAHKGRGER
jgi:hypothetical protein